MKITFNLILLLFLIACKEENKNSDDKVFYDTNKFCMGADLSYVNQILDQNGVYKDSGITKDPYSIFRDKGTNLVRLRLWHNPTWTKEVYGEQGQQMYNDLYDVERSIAAARNNNMSVLLDFHYSDTWADPGRQNPPDAWKNITDLNVLADSVYNYTARILTYLKERSLLPEMIQLGNEVNCGMLVTNIEAGFPTVDVCDGHWAEQGQLINAAIKAVRDISEDPEIILHLADPKNVQWWFSNMMDKGNVTDFETIGISYYPLWHTEIPYSNIPGKITAVRSQFDKKIMILEVAYPWTTENNDNYNNLFGSQPEVEGFSYTPEGQRSFMIEFIQEMINAGVSGIVYWEPAWISSDMKDLWGTGSSWENSALFDFEGNPLPAFDYMTFPYQFK